MSARNKASAFAPARGAARIAAAGLLLALAGCALGPDFQRPAPPEVERYTSAPLAAVGGTGYAPEQRFVAGQRIAADWWRLFGSPQLDAAVRLAIGGNASLQAAQATLRQSQESLRAGYGVFYPRIDASLGAARERSSPLRFGPGGGGGGIFNLFTLTTAISYAIDVFGGQRRALEGLGAQVDYQRYGMLATWLTVSGNVVNAMIARAAYSGEIDATLRLVARQRDQLAIVEAQARAGTVPYSNVLSIRALLAASLGTLPGLNQKRDQAGHLLASLVGRAPAAWTAPPLELARLTLPAQLPLTLPSDLVRQRPDILAAEARLHAASADIGVATAALFPVFSLDATYGASAETFGALGQQQGRFWSVGPQASVPLFEGGAAWHRRKAALEAWQASLADYRQTVLDAFAQVADTLTALGHDAQAVQAQGEALEAAGQALTLVEANYRAGVAGYLEVIVANTQLYQANINYLQALAQRCQDSAALFVALGGGWWNVPPPAPAAKPGP